MQMFQGLCASIKDGNGIEVLYANTIPTRCWDARTLVGSVLVTKGEISVFMFCIALGVAGQDTRPRQ